MRLTFTLSLFFILLTSSAQKTVSNANPTQVGGVKWLTIEQAEAAQKKLPKKILVDIYTSWCRWCKVTDSVVYRNPELVKYLNQNFYCVKYNAESKTSVRYNNVRYDFLNDGRDVNEFAIYLLNGKMSYPGTVFLSEDGKRIDGWNGYMDAYYMEAVLHYYGSNSYKEMSYKNFENDFEGKIDE